MAPGAPRRCLAGDERLSGRVMALAAPCGPLWGAAALNRGQAPLDAPMGSPGLASPGFPVTGWACCGACGKTCGKPLRVVWAALWKNLWKTSAVGSVTDCHSPIPNHATDALW